MPITSLVEVVSDRTDVHISPERVLLDVPQGLRHTMAIIILVIWYIASGATLFLNKYILSHLHGDAFVLGTTQLFISVISSYIQMGFTNKFHDPVQKSSMAMKNLYRDMLFIGAFRCATVIFGLFAMKYIAVSFLATIKSSSPLFTVIISRILLGERTSYGTKVSMIPITTGLCLCSSFELSFDMFGFLCALGTNIFDCLQNVYSKLLLSGEKYRYTAIELQLWTSLVACVFQIPLLYYYVDLPSVINSTSKDLMILYAFNGFFYHMQSVCAFALMAYISPITHSVVNTVKRGLLIWLSILIFGNPVTFLSGFGTILVIIGVILYNEGRNDEGKSGNYLMDTTKLITWRDI
ncbi:unnamed protein product [Adineta ricciae]|uniref:Sugar phosphate transporter domain-containing protein n=1 Tax=Adineta ricciae TaxID=249248 RepID=A0A814N969_ADIRI|nr:unnamed protein product [Adineta ricciae]